MKPARSKREARGYAHDPEVALMLRVRADDDAAFAELLERYRARVLSYFVRHLGDWQEAEDLTQDVFLRLYRSRQRYRPRAKFGTWLFHIMQNVARNAVRSRRRRPWVRMGTLTHTSEGRSLEHLCPDRSEPPSRSLERAEAAAVVHEALSGLAERQRAALHLHQFEDCTYAEVAAELAMTPKAAKSLLYRARNQLRASLRELAGAREAIAAVY